MNQYKRFFVFLLILSVLFPSFISAQEEYTFDLSEIEKKSYHLGGYVEFLPVFLGLDRDASLYRLKFYNRNQGNLFEEYNLRLHMDGSYEWEKVALYIKSNFDLQKTYPGWSEEIQIYEGYVSTKPSFSFNLDFGKRTLKWGKGYAWNPVAFVDRLKNPDDPEIGLEGFIMAKADYIKSFASGPLQTMSITPVIVPVYKNVNEDFGKVEHLNWAGKIYFLVYDTDVDFLLFSGGSKSNKYGIDFARNIRSNFEIHGEFTYMKDVNSLFIDANGGIYENINNAKSFLVGIRYLTRTDITYICEYYHNGTGFSKKEMRNFYSFLDKAYNQYVFSGNDELIKKASQLNFARINPMKDYLYLRISQKEPYDILYFTPSITIIYNIPDSSFSFSPEVLYNPVTNFELRLKAVIVHGEYHTEYGEKQNDYKIELRTRYYF